MAAPVLDAGVPPTSPSPSPFPAGWWVAADGKAVLLEPAADAGLLVTVAPARGARAYESAELLRGGTKPIHRLEATLGRDPAHGSPFLVIEAGTPGLGPTYRLRLVAKDVRGRWAVAGAATPKANLVMLPSAHIGLYDDWDDDLGVPWAFPLQPFRWAGEV